MNNEKTGRLISEIRQQKNMTQQNIVARADKVSLQVLKKEQKTKHKFIVFIAVFTVIILLLILVSYQKVIFQRGNPIPYLIASTSINEETPYVAVGNNTGTYISKKGECSELFRFVESSKNVNFVEQAGSSYIFTNGVDNIVISSETYWRYFTVWEVPQHTLQAR